MCRRGPSIEALAIGIDAEQIIASDRASDIAPRVTLPKEAVVGGRSLAPGLRVSILFSIKEAVFKCLYPLVLKRFYYDALSVTTIDLAAGTFRCRTHHIAVGPLSSR